MLDIGLEIKILRERLKVSSKELASRIGLSQSQMSRLEKGQRRIDTTILHKIAAALGVDPAFFFRSSGGGTMVATEPDHEALPAQIEGSESTEPVPPAVVPRLRFTHLGQLVRTERRRRHLTIDELSTKVGRTKAFMSAFESGRHGLDAEFADKITRALRLPVNFFVEAQQETVRVLETQVARLDQALAEAHRGDADTDRRAAVPLYGTLGPDLQLAFDADDYPIGEPEDFLALPGLEVNRCFAVTISGDAMMSEGNPSFREGDIVVFGGGVPRSRDFVLIKFADDSLTFRQIFFDPEARVRLQPLNLNHGAGTYSRKALKSLWKLVLHIARM